VRTARSNVKSGRGNSDAARIVSVVTDSALPPLGAFGVRNAAHPRACVADDLAKQNVTHDSSNPYNRLISNLIQTQLAAAGLTANVQCYPTAQIYEWIGGDGSAAPEVLTLVAWPAGLLVG